MLALFLLINCVFADGTPYPGWGIFGCKQLVENDKTKCKECKAGFKLTDGKCQSLFILFSFSFNYHKKY